MQLFDKIKYHISPSLSLHAYELTKHLLDRNGGTPTQDTQGLGDVDYVVTDTPHFEGWQNFVERKGWAVTPRWVERSVVLGKLQPPQYYSPDPAMLFSGVVACATELPTHDLEVLSAGVLALGGQWRTGLTKDVTHLFAIRAASVSDDPAAASSSKYATAVHFQSQTGVKIVLPHWFDDCVRLGIPNLDTKPYEFPDPPLLRNDHGIVPAPEEEQQDEETKRKEKARKKAQQVERDPLKRSIYSSVVKYTPATPKEKYEINMSFDPASSQTAVRGDNNANANEGRPSDVEVNTKDVWKGKRILLARNLRLGGGARREAVEAGIIRAGGSVIRWEDDEEDEFDPEDLNPNANADPGLGMQAPAMGLSEKEKKMAERIERSLDRAEAEAVKDCDIFVSRWRVGRGYVEAFKSHKTIGTLAWLYHVQSTGVVSRPLDQLLHYPIPKGKIPGFKEHEITVTNYTGEAREYLKKLIMTMGASFTPSMSGRNTVLIAATKDSTKAQKALSWSIPVVNHTWLEDCFVQWRNLTLATEKYLKFPEGVDFSVVLGERGVNSGGYHNFTGPKERRGRIDEEVDELAAVYEGENEADAKEPVVLGKEGANEGDRDGDVTMGETTLHPEVSIEDGITRVDGREGGEEIEMDEGPRTAERDRREAEEVEKLFEDDVLDLTKSQSQPQSQPRVKGRGKAGETPKGKVVSKQTVTPKQKTKETPKLTQKQKPKAKAKAKGRKDESEEEDEIEDPEEAEEEEEEEEEPQESQVVVSANARRKSKVVESEEEEEEEERPKRGKGVKERMKPKSPVKSTSKTKGALTERAKAKENDTSSDSDSSVDLVRPRRKRTVWDDSEEDEEDEEEKEKPKKGRKSLLERPKGDAITRIRKSLGGKEKERDAVKEKEKEIKKGKAKAKYVESGEEEEEEEEEESPSRRAAMSRAKAKDKGKEKMQVLELSDLSDTESDEELPMVFTSPVAGKTKANGKAKQGNGREREKEKESGKEKNKEKTPLKRVVSVLLPTLELSVERKKKQRELEKEEDKQREKKEKEQEKKEKEREKKKEQEKKKEREREKEKKKPKPRVSVGKGKGKKDSDVEMDDAEEEEEVRPKSRTTRPSRRTTKKPVQLPSDDEEEGEDVRMDVDEGADAPRPSSQSSVARSSSPGGGRHDVSQSQGRTKRSAATKASAKLRDELMPDLVNFEEQLRKSKKGKVRGRVSDYFVVEGDSVVEKAKESKEKEKGVGSSSNANVKGKRRRHEEEEDEGGKEREESEEQEEEEVRHGKKKRRVSVLDEQPVVGKAKAKAKTKEKEKESQEDDKNPGRQVYILATQVKFADNVSKALVALGAKFTDRPSDCTHLVAKGLVRTEKFLCALARAPFIVSEEWVKESAKAKKLLPESDFLLKDPTGEAKYGVTVRTALERARKNAGKLLQGKTFYLTPKVPVGAGLIKSLVTACGGHVAPAQPTVRILKSSPGRYVIAHADDVRIWRSIADSGIPVYSQELILMGVLRQEISWDEEAFRVDLEGR